jgi:hypothetical protein
MTVCNGVNGDTMGRSPVYDIDAELAARHATILGYLAGVNSAHPDGHNDHMSAVAAILWLKHYRHG